MNTLTETDYNFPNQTSKYSGKVREVYKIKNDVLFVGLGKTFQIWEPKNFEKFKISARKKAYQNRSKLKWENKQKGEL